MVASLQGSDVFTFVSPTMAVDPANPKHLYVAYIEADITSNFFHDCSETAYATDVVQSLDGGATWMHMGLKDTHHVVVVTGHLEAHIELRRKSRKSNLAAVERSAKGGLIH